MTISRRPQVICKGQGNNKWFNIQRQRYVDVKDTGARLGLESIILMDEKMSKQFVRGYLRICMYLWKTL